MGKISLQATQIDSLTNLPNRAYVIERLEKKLSSAKQNKKLTEFDVQIKVPNKKKILIKKICYKTQDPKDRVNS